MKRALKAVAALIATIMVVPAVGLFRLGAILGGQDRAFPGWSQAFALFPGQTGVYLRRAFYRAVLREFANDACVGFGTVFSHATAQVGPRAYVGVGCSLGDVTLEPDSLVASHVSIMNGASQHGIDRTDIPIREQHGVWKRVTVGRGAWIGERSVVMADIGRHCIVGAGSVVTRPIPDYAIAVGAPARVIRFRQPAAAASVDG